LHRWSRKLEQAPDYPLIDAWPRLSTSAGVGSKPARLSKLNCVYRQFHRQTVTGLVLGWLNSRGSYVSPLCRPQVIQRSNKLWWAYQGSPMTSPWSKKKLGLWLVRAY
jgi:hypothetical protein